jgi:hypothetical protein
MLDWSEEFVGRVGSDRNKQVMAQLERGNMHVSLLPPQASKYVSPCDNSFFAALKVRLGHMDTSTTIAEKAALQEVCRDYPSEMVVGFFRHCGWEF